MSLVAEALCNHVISGSVPLLSPHRRKEYAEVGSSYPLVVDRQMEIPYL